MTADLTMIIDLTTATVVHYSSETNEVTGVYMEESRDSLKKFEEILATMAGLSTKDEREIFKIIRVNNPPMCVRFSGKQASFGSGVAATS